MKKIFKLSAILALCAAVAGLGACTNSSEFDPNPMGGDIAFLGMAPNPVMRGGALNIIGCNLDKIKEVQFAGDVSVTEFQDLKKGSRLDTLIVVVPLEGPAVGKVTLVTSDKVTLTSLANLEFTEPIEIQSFSPATVLSGDVLTFKGEYLNDVKEVFFTGENVYVTKFESQSRHELKVVVPATAITGPVILSDVNEVEDQNTIPNHIYTSTDLVVGQPTVTKAAKATYKSGDVITVTGAHLDMIKTVDLAGAADVAFSLAADAKSFTFNLPPSATDGNITLTSFADDKFDAGEIETVTVTALAIKSLAEDNRYKAGVKVEITGEDLDLVTKVEFTGAEAFWSISDDKIEATQPEAAKDGVVTVTLASGKQAFTPEIEVVKPVVKAVDKTEAIAGKDKVVVSGDDLDLVTGVTIGTKDKTFINCEYELVTDEESGNVNVSVSIPSNAYSGVLTLTAASGYLSETESITVTYDEVVSISFDAPEFGLGNNISLTGKNLMKIEQIFIKGKKVTDFVVRTDTAMSFAIPDKIGPGVYRLDLVLVDGTELTWSVPFTITAPFTETFFWEGNIDLSGGAQPYLGDDGALAGKLEVGDLIRVYFTVPGDDWWFEIFCGHWDGQLLKATPDNTDVSAGYCVIEVTDDNIGKLTATGGWGGVLVVQGNVTVTGASVVHFGAAEQKTVIWEGSAPVDWSGNTPGAEGSMGALSWGGYDWSTVEAGTILRFEFERTADEVQIRVSNGSWSALPGTTDPYKPEGTSLDVELTADMLAELVNAGGLVVTGQGFTLTEVSLVSSGPAVPAGQTIWEGSAPVDWSGNTPGAEGSMGALSWGGYDWSTVEAGTILRFEFERTADEVQIRVSNGSWSALPGTTDPYLPEGDDLEVELTADMLAELVNAGGLVVTGQGFTLTAVILK